jgi:hypothetical protein
LRGHGSYPKERDHRVPKYFNLEQIDAVLYTTEVAGHFDTLRSFFLRSHRRRMTQVFFLWLHQQPKYRPVGISDSYVVGLANVVNPQEAAEGPVYKKWTRLGLPIYAEWWHGRFKAQQEDLQAGHDSLRRYANTSWWEWSDDSRCMHWPRWYQDTIRDGLKVWFREAPKQWVSPQPGARKAPEKEAIRKKIDKVLKIRYVVPGEVISLTSFFTVPKGADDIRVVFDGTKSGLNECIWVPRFPLPTVETLLRAVGPDTYMGDFDIGECFF